MITHHCWLLLYEIYSSIVSRWLLVLTLLPDTKCKICDPWLACRVETAQQQRVLHVTWFHWELEVFALDKIDTGNDDLVKRKRAGWKHQLQTLELFSPVLMKIVHSKVCGLPWLTETLFLDRCAAILRCNFSVFGVAQINRFSIALLKKSSRNVDRHWYTIFLPAPTLPTMQLHLCQVDQRSGCVMPVAANVAWRL